jgi:hypothetical protein
MHKVAPNSFAEGINVLSKTGAHCYLIYIVSAVAIDKKSLF